MAGASAGMGAPAGRRRRLIRLTPLVDIIFILLIFFMLASRLETPGGVPIGLAERADSDATEPVALRVVVAPAGMVRIAGDRVDSADLVARVEAALRLQPGRAVHIAPAGEVSLGRLLDHLTRLQTAGIGPVALAPAASVAP